MVVKGFLIKIRRLEEKRELPAARFINST